MALFLLITDPFFSMISVTWKILDKTGLARNQSSFLIFFKNEFSVPYDSIVKKLQASNKMCDNQSSRPACFTDKIEHFISKSLINNYSNLANWTSQIKESTHNVKIFWKVVAGIVEWGIKCVTESKFLEISVWLGLYPTPREPLRGAT